MTNLIDIKNSKVDTQTIAFLEEMLEMAKKGEIKSILYVCNPSDNQIFHGWEGAPNDEMMAFLDRLKLGYLLDTMGDRG